MVENAAEMLNKRLTHYLSNRLGWRNLNAIQNKAIPVILGGNDTLVLAPTASGKTEAVLLPIFSELIDKGLEPTSVLYVSPLKALINDMHDRISKWANHFHFTATKWHGDVSKTVKDKYVKNPTDFLSITPESLEVILMRKSDAEKKKIFKNIKYVIIDEIHYFADSDRGVQLNSLLNRISFYCENDFQTIGLSATVGNPEMIAEWINIKKPAQIVMDDDKRIHKYRLKHFKTSKLIKYLKNNLNKKILIFVNSRAAAEDFHYLLKSKIDFKNIFIHHSSVGKNTREENEEKFKKSKSAIMISTSTLELGIDIGNIDMVIQIDPPNNVSSFLQRIGRSGRKTKIQKSMILTSDWGTLESLAELILIDENRIEEIKISNQSKDILFHQILSSLFERGRIKALDLYSYLSGCYAFSGISLHDFKRILKTMKENEFIDIYSGNYLSLGYNFEKVFGKKNFMDFYSVFFPNSEYKLKKGKREVGTIDSSFAVNLNKNSVFMLGGKAWKIKNIDDNYRIISVDTDVPKPNIPVWYTEGPPLSYLISRKVYDILLGDFNKSIYYKYLDDDSRSWINLLITKAKESNYSKGIIPVKIYGNQVEISTFAGDKANSLLSFIFKLYYETYAVQINPFFLSFKVREKIYFEDIQNIFYNIEETLKKPEAIEFIDDEVGRFYKNKFINYLPKTDEVLLKMNILFDIDGLIDLSKTNELAFIQKNYVKTIFEKEEKSTINVSNNNYIY